LAQRGLGDVQARLPARLQAEVNPAADVVEAGGAHQRLERDAGLRGQQLREGPAVGVTYIPAEGKARGAPDAAAALLRIHVQGDVLRVLGERGRHGWGRVAADDGEALD